MTGEPASLRIEAFLTSGLGPIAAARVIEPLRLAATRPGVTAGLHVGEARFPDRMDGRGAVFLRYRPQGLPESWALHRAVLQAGYLLVADVDDLLWEGGDASVGEADRARRVAGYRDSDYVAYRGVHAIQASTPFLAEELRRFNPTVRVFPATVADVPDLPPRRPGPPRLVFAALNRAADWRPILEPLNRVLERRPDVQMITVHDAAFHAALATENKEFAGFQPYAQYLETLGSGDVALLPLADTRFNRAKSDLKFVECAARGTAVLASDVAYGDSVEDDVTGLLYRTPEAFETQLERLLDDGDLRGSLTRKAHAWVRRERDLQAGVDARLAWYRELLADKQHLDAELMRRAGWILDPHGRPPAGVP